MESGTAMTTSVCADESETRKTSRTHRNCRPTRSEKAKNSQMGSELSAYASISDMEPEEPLSTIEGQHPPNHWEKIIKWHAADLEQLPVPPKDFVKREKKALRRRKMRLAFIEAGLRFLALSEEDEKRAAAEPKTRLKDLLPRDKQRTLNKPNDTCHNWVLRPTTEKTPEPNAGVPSIVVTTPGGETRWPKDMNPYITKEEVASITERVTKEHDGIMSELHCQTFQESYQRGLIEEPYGHRPEILFCTKCCERQMQIEDEEAWLASKGFPRVEEQLGYDQGGMGMGLLFPATLKIASQADLSGKQTEC